MIYMFMDFLLDLFTFLKKNIHSMMYFLNNLNSLDIPTDSFTLSRRKSHTSQSYMKRWPVFITQSTFSIPKQCRVSFLFVWLKIMNNYETKKIFKYIFICFSTTSKIQYTRIWDCMAAGFRQLDTIENLFDLFTFLYNSSPLQI